MKTTITINLGRTLFSIDEDAYQILKDYLVSIEVRLLEDSTKQEIMDDIENRLAELLTERAGTESRPVNAGDIREVIEVMGDPVDISGSSKKSDSGYDKGFRRIYRNTDTRLLGGVCSGLALYLSVDVIWVRIAFVILSLFFFSGFLIYLLLWIVTPPATTLEQKEEMKGEPVRIKNVIRSVKREFRNVRNNFRI